MCLFFLKEAEEGAVSSNGCNKEDGRLPEEDQPGEAEQVNTSNLVRLSLLVFSLEAGFIFLCFISVFEEFSFVQADRYFCPALDFCLF